jgi:hypothetical protein
MSEFQYYEFVAIDRPLSARAQQELRACSSRATITSTRFVNSYHWGDLKANPSAWVDKYFDAFLYFANWGSRELVLRFPRKQLPFATAKQYASGEAASVRSKGQHVMLELLSEDESGDGFEPAEGVLGAITPIRNEIARGDHRALYVAWLLNVQHGCVGEDEPEPPCPPGLSELSASLEALVEFLRLDRDLLAAAAEGSPRMTTRSTTVGDARREIAKWPAKKKDALLARVAVDDPLRVRDEILGLMRIDRRTDELETRVSVPRTVGQLLEHVR